MFPQSSVAVKVTVSAPVAPHSSLNATKSLLHVMVPHSSSAVAPPLLVNQAFRAVVLPAPSHSTVSSVAPAVRVGAVVSSMVNVAVVDAALPQSSVAVKMTSTAPVPARQSIIIKIVGPSDVATEIRGCSGTSIGKEPGIQPTVLPVPLHSKVMSMASLRCSAAVSLTVKVAAVWKSCRPPVTVKVTCSDSESPQPGTSPVLLFVQTRPPHASVAVAPPPLSRLRIVSSNRFRHTRRWYRRPQP